jgi:O-antigen/teichoic acid export membrane protein
LSADPEQGRAKAGAIGRLRERIAFYAGHRGLRERVVAPVTFNALVLGTNVVTGIIVARTLGPSGRGEIAAILVLAFTGAWLFSVGSTNAIAYRQSHTPHEAPLLVGSWLAITAVTSVLAIVVAELVLPTLFSAQTSAAIDLARVYIPTIALLLTINVFNGFMLGDQDFLAYNVTRALMPTLVAVGYLGLLLSDSFSVEAALIANAVAVAITCVVVVTRCLRRHGVRAPRVDMVRETLRYGLESHGGSMAGFVNARLDLLIIPAFLAAASVGLYSVATNVASVIGTLTGTIALFVLPVAVRRRTGAPRTVVRTLHATLAIGFAIAIPVALVAQFALELLYGSKFGGAATALRLMLPGEVLDASSMVVWSGLLAANRPILSSVAAAPGAVLTIGGLILFLESGGIEAAAAITTSAHTLVFVISIALYRRVHDLSWRDFLQAPAS